MNCTDWEERIACYAGGDAAESEAEIERHLAECARCREFETGLRGSLALLREAHEEPLAAAHFTAVRTRVLAELERRRAPVWRRGWVWGLAAAALAVVAVAGLRLEPAPRVDPPVVALHYPEAPVVSRLVVPERVVARPAGKPEQVMIRIVTDNPDVVLYWIAETKGVY